jgi:uncharacterized delta-60 repeat protein
MNHKLLPLLLLFWACLSLQAQPGTIDATFKGSDPATGANVTVWAIAVQPDGEILIGGDFTSYNGTERNHIARLNADGSLDTGFDPSMGSNNTVYAIALQPDGKILIGGGFTSYNGTARSRIARLNTDGSLDTSFDPGTGASSWVDEIALQPDGKILIAGDFTSYNGTERVRVARLNADGSLDTGFDPGTGANIRVWAIALQPDGKILIGGLFDSYNGTERNHIARLNADGSLDTGFDPGTGANNWVWSMALQPDGKILIAGDFTFYNGTERFRIARLNADGSLDTGLNPGTGSSNRSNAMALQPDGKIIIVGNFISYNGTARRRIAQLNADGSLDTGFDPGTGASDWVRAIALQPDGKILIGGAFTSYNGTVSNHVARLNGACSGTPMIVCKNTTVFIGNAGTYTIQSADVFNATASFDNCSGELTVTNISPEMVSCTQLNQIIPVVVTVEDASGNMATCTAQITVQEGTALPVGWNSADVGNANGTAGYKACSLNGSFTVAATGFSTSSADVLHFAHRQLCGNGEIIARVEADSGGGWAGVMLRESLLPGSKKVTLKTQLTNNIRREIRSVTNGGAAVLNLTRPQHTWFRLVRNGSSFTGYTSTNGTNWSFAFSATVNMTGCIYAGVFAESINGNTTTTANFSNVNIIGAQNNLAVNPVNGVGDLDGIMPTHEVNIYPNPTTGELSINLDIHAGKPGNVLVFNALGELVAQERLVPGKLETHNMRIAGSAGVYTVVIQLDDLRIVRRVVVDPNGRR